MVVVVALVLIAAVVAPVADGVAKWSTDNGASVVVSVAVVAVAVRHDDRTNRTAARCDVQPRLRPRRPVTWLHTRVAPQSTASVITAARATGPVRCSCLPPIPSTWPPRPHTP